MGNTSSRDFIHKSTYMLLRALETVMNSLRGASKPNDPHLFDAELLATKLFQHVGTAYYLRNGTFVDDTRLHFYDFASLAVIVRAALETYLKFHEVYIQPATDDEREFTYSVWQLWGHLKRASFGPPFDSESMTSYQESVDKAAKIQNDLRKFKTFRNLDKNQRKNVLEGKSIQKIDAVLKSAGFNSQFRKLYGYHSDYVHSNSSSAWQIGSAIDSEKQQWMFDRLLSNINVVCAKFIIDYTALFPEAALALAKNKRTFSTVRYWVSIAMNE